MSLLFVEISCEEIPARLQVDSIKALHSRLMDGLSEAGFSPVAGRSAISPRHMAVEITGLEARLADRVSERRGPRSDAPDKAIDGFCQSAGLTREALHVRETDKGSFLFANVTETGAVLAEILVPLINNVINQFPWPKSQRWSRSTVTWVRPLRSVSVLVDGAAIEGEVILGGGMVMPFGTQALGHPFYTHDPIQLSDFDSYLGDMKAAHVIVDAESRREDIMRQSGKLADTHGIELVPDEGLLREVTGLVEWPHAILGRIQPEFMELPAEVLVTSMRVHQKFFATRYPEGHEKSGQLAPYFLTIANRDCNADQVALIATGNERVLKARLADAAFFWHQDNMTPLETLLPKLGSVAFFDGLGTVAEKADRLANLAGQFAHYLAGCNEADAVRAAHLSKADLLTGMVGEFPELQGIMGGYYAASGDETAAVSQAISDHYRPQGPSDNLPHSSEGYAVSLADKLDTLTGFFGIDQKPTGSRDPYALRRAALGILRIMDEADIALPLDKLMKHAADLYHFDDSDEDLPGFFRERLRVVLRSKDIAHDVVSAVLGCHDGIGHLHLIMRQSAQLDSFLKTDPGIAVLSAWRRVASLLSAEEKKAALLETVPSSALFETEQEAQLMAAVNMLPEMMPDTPAAMAELMTAMAALAEPIEQFFTHVMINSEIDEIRLNRLALLRLVRSRMGLIGDLSQIEGG